MLDSSYLAYVTVARCFSIDQWEYPNKIWSYMVQYLHFRILKISH